MNPLLTLNLKEHKIDFTVITAEHFKEALDVLLPEIKKEHETTANEAPFEYFHLFESQDNHERLSDVFNILGHINTVSNSDEIQAVFELYETTLSEVYTKMSLDERVYHKLCSYTNTPDFKALDNQRKLMIYDQIDYMADAGIDLPENKKEELYKIAVDKGTLITKFSQNIMQSQLHSHVIFTEEDLPDLPQRCYDILHSCEVVSEEGVTPVQYKIPFATGLYIDILINCSNAEARKKCFEENIRLGVTAPYDNRILIQEIADIFHKEAHLLGFKNYSDKKMRKYMAQNPQKAIEFINDLAQKSLPFAKIQQKEMLDFGKSILGRKPEPYDLAYIEEIYTKQNFALDNEKIREYFTVSQLMSGFFEIFQTLYKIKFQLITDEKLWNPDVMAYEVQDLEGKKIGKIYFDLFLREQKRPGAWMSGMISKDKSFDKKTTTDPVVYVVCNAPKEVNSQPTLDYDEVQTFFHEMGHALHHLLTKVDFDYFSGLNNVQMDAIELPSQFMENFCFDYEVLKKITAHKTTGEVLPRELFDKMESARNFNKAIALVRQCTLSKLDLLIFSTPGSNPIEIEKQVRNEWKITDELPPSRLVTPTFSHIFEGYYSSGYYSYAWAEVLAADCFAALKESGSTYTEQIEASNAFKSHILEVGGVNDMNENFFNFRGREPDVKYLLQGYGIEI